MSKFRTMLNLGKPDNERNTQPSMTVPDQTMSIKEIERRFGAGLPLGGGRRADAPDTNTMDEDDLLLDENRLMSVNPKTLDLAEISDLREGIKSEMTDITDREINRKQAQKEKRAAEHAAKLLEEKTKVEDPKK